ncbi:uncharacterized protein C2845_PM07G36420 [Panicum miliaceum]|uniref:RNase H type-1 domain-containing protein n=1 Tax=Panicum miliaceum TaxID=4540 RepID=A0A3L6SGR7_PANMI|nr:uncharacterized protein C2845_PM07G36420 [Panicum miliaceum]
MGARQMKKIHFVNQDIIGRFPDHVSSRTLMMVLFRCREDQWRSILDSPVGDRTVVLLDWAEDPKATKLEVLFRDNGLMLPPQSGTTSDPVIYKGECDASFYTHGKSPLDKLKARKSQLVGNEGQTSVQKTGPESDRAGTAAVASFLWKHGNLLEVLVAKDKQCVGSQHAEAVALLSILKRGREHGIDSLDVVTDCEENQQILMGARLPSMSEHPETCMAFIQASKEYTICKCRWEPREMLSHVNDVARAAFCSEQVDLKEVLEERASRFWGMPFVRVKQNRNKTIEKLGKVLVNREKILCASTYYIPVPDNGHKADAFEGLLHVLDPSFVVVLVTSYESAYNVKHILSPKYSCAVWEGGTQIGQNDDCSNTRKSAYILADQCVVPYFCSEKTPVVVYDSLPNVQYNSPQDLTSVIPVHLVCSGETLPFGAKEVDPLLFGFFRYPVTSGVVLKAKADNNDYVDGYSDEK